LELLRIHSIPFNASSAQQAIAGGHVQAERIVEAGAETILHKPATYREFIRGNVFQEVGGRIEPISRVIHDLIDDVQLDALFRCDVSGVEKQPASLRFADLPR
jgi:hypothetical protein